MELSKDDTSFIFSLTTNLIFEIYLKEVCLYEKAVPYHVISHYSIMRPACWMR